MAKKKVEVPEPKVKKYRSRKVHEPILGRPKKYDLYKEADELIEWCKNPDSTSLYAFTFNKDYLCEEMNNFAESNDHFSKAYKKAKEMIAINRERHCNAQTMNYGVWARSVPIYDKMVCVHERSEKDEEYNRKLRMIKEEIELKSKAGEVVDPNTITQFTALMEQINKLQSKRSTASNTDKTEDKS